MILDATDLRLLHFLQQDGRISNQELAEKVALSPSACLRRLRLLESEGIISGYRAVLNAEQLGIELEAIVHLSLRQDVETGMRRSSRRCKAGRRWRAPM